MLWKSHWHGAVRVQGERERERKGVLPEPKSCLQIKPHKKLLVEQALNA